MLAKFPGLALALETAEGCWVGAKLRGGGFALHDYSGHCDGSVGQGREGFVEGRIDVLW